MKSKDNTETAHDVTWDNLEEPPTEPRVDLLRRKSPAITATAATRLTPRASDSTNPNSTSQR